MTEGQATSRWGLDLVSYVERAVLALISPTARTVVRRQGVAGLQVGCRLTCRRSPVAPGQA